MFCLFSLYYFCIEYNYLGLSMEIKLDFKDYSNRISFSNDYLKMEIWENGVFNCFRQCHKNDILMLKVYKQNLLEYQFKNMPESLVISFDANDYEKVKSFMKFLYEELSYGN